ncbi:MAG: amidohydrolase family protein [Clostridiales Family XIII bacterium]|jgi:imidazolonepropionase-like amidohydrolase|nr:amidohydrolase family protein [Clostridiales Family XIII bacterium]
MRVLLKNVHLLDAEREYMPADVLVDGEDIAATGADLASGDAEVVDLSGYTLMPGFFDAHMHAARRGRDNEDMLRAYARNGVCAVADLGITGVGTLEHHMEFLRGLYTPEYPYITSAGRFVDVPEGYGMGPEAGMAWGIQVECAEDIRAAVEYLAQGGANGVKTGISDGIVGTIRAAMDRDMMTLLADEARRRGLWSAAHIGRVKDLRTVVECGIDQAAHTPGDEEMDDELVALMVTRSIPMTTTMGDMTGTHPMNIPPSYGTLKVFNEHRRIMQKNLKKFYDAGGTILIGTDLAKSDDFEEDAVIPYFELAQLLDAGIPMRDAIRCGTSNPAKVFGFERLGLVEPGMKACMIAFPGALDDAFKALDHPPFVINRGQILTEPAAR